MKVVQLGGGNMGGALLARWQEALEWDFTLVDPGKPEVPVGVTRHASPEHLPPDNFDILIVAVKPQLVADAVPVMGRCLKRNGVVLSIAAGTPMARFSELLGQRPVIRAMPNLPVRVGEGLTGLCANEGTGPTERALADELFAPTGATVWLDDEDGIDRFTAIAGSGPGYLFELLRGYASAAMALGFDEERAVLMATQTVKGAVELARETGAPFAALRDSVTSKGGTTAAGLEIFRGEDGFENLFRRGTKAAYERARALRA